MMRTHPTAPKDSPGHRALWLMARALFCGVALVAATGASAHEGATPHASVVQREGGLYNLSLTFDVARALHRTVQPDAAPGEFLAAHSAMAPDRFAQVWARAVAAWSKDTTLLQGPVAIAASRWQWPTPQAAQALLREHLMHSLTAGAAAATDDAPHGVAQARADFSAPASPRHKAISLKLHAALRPLSLTSYRPQQQWVGPGDGGIALRF